MPDWINEVIDEVYDKAIREGLSTETADQEARRLKAEYAKRQAERRAEQRRREREHEARRDAAKDRIQPFEVTIQGSSWDGRKHTTKVRHETRFRDTKTGDVYFSREEAEKQIDRMEGRR